MIDSILAFSIRRRWLVVVAAVAVAMIGAWNFTRLSIDAVPDITNVQVQVNTQAPGYSPLETEQRLTFPIETAMSGLPKLQYTRSISRYGLSQVTLVFRDGTDIYFARQLTNERLDQIKTSLPPGISVSMGPISTGLGEIFTYTVEANPDARTGDGKPYSPADLRTIQDWSIKPQLRTVPGIVEVNTIGGDVKQFHVLPEPARLIAYKLTFRDVMTALAANNENVGAGFIERNGEQYLVRTPGQVKTLAEISNIVVGARSGVPILVRDVADVREGSELRTGSAIHNGNDTVVGTAMLLIGENSRAAAQRVARKLADIAPSLPDGVFARAIYDRTHLVDATIATVERNLVEGALLVVVVLFVILGNIRAALVTACVIPLSMLFTITGMVENKVSANLMSLGAIDFGIIVDGAVIVVENCLRILADEQRKRGRVLDKSERFAALLAGAKEVVGPSLFGTMIIAVVYLPVLTLTDIEGKMFTPMAITVLMALLGAAIFSVTFVPAAIALLVTGKVAEHESIFMRWAAWIYRPALDFALRFRGAVLVGAVLLLVGSLGLASRMGGEFIPSLDEGDIVFQVTRIPGTGISQSVEMQRAVDRAILEFPEVREIVSKIGTAEVATDPMPPGASDTLVMLKPRTAWPDPERTKEDLIDTLQRRLQAIPGNAYELSQPIQMRFNELISGVRSDVGVKIFGDDLATLLQLGGRVQASLQRVRGAADVKTEQVAGLPVLTVQINRAALARYGLSVADVQQVVEIAMGGRTVGLVFEGDRRFELVVRLPERLRVDIDALSDLPVPLPGALTTSATRYVPLAAVATVALDTGPNQISRENGKRRIVVTANVRERDLGGFVAEAQRAVAAQVKLPAGYWITWGGQFEQLAAATDRLTVVVPVALLLIFVLLCLSLGSVADAALVFTGVPLALTGGIAGLWLRDIPLSISAGVGFIALSGVAVLNGLVIVAFIERRRASGAKVIDAVREGALSRLRPVLMTALVASLGFVPMAIATGAGAEVQRPLATVVIGGIVSSTLLTLLVLPALYAFFRRDTAPVARSNDISQSRQHFMVNNDRIG